MASARVNLRIERVLLGDCRSGPAEFETGFLKCWTVPALGTSVPRGSREARGVLADAKSRTRRPQTGRMSVAARMRRWTGGRSVGAPGAARTGWDSTRRSCVRSSSIVPYRHLDHLGQASNSRRDETRPEVRNTPAVHNTAPRAPRLPSRRFGHRRKALPRRAGRCRYRACTCRQERKAPLRDPNCKTGNPSNFRRLCPKVKGRGFALHLIHMRYSRRTERDCVV